MPAKIAKILPMLFRDTRSFWSSVIVVTMPKSRHIAKRIGCIPQHIGKGRPDDLGHQRDARRDHEKEEW